MLRRRQSTRHTHVADRQMTEAATEGSESDELLLRPCIYTNSSLPSSGRDSYLLKMARRSWMTSQLSPLLLERDIADVFYPDNHSGWLIIMFTDHWMFSWSLCPETDRDWLSSVSRLAARNSRTSELFTPELVLTKQFWHDSRQWAVRPLASLQSGFVSGIHIKVVATKISNYSSRAGSLR